MPQTPWEALTKRRFLLTAWPWRSAGYLVTGAPAALAAALAMALLCAPWVLAFGRAPTLTRTTPLLVLGGLLLAAFGPLVAMPLASAERRRLRLVDARPIESGHRRPPARGLLTWARTRYSEAATWRELGYFVLLATVLPVLYLTLSLVLLLLLGFLFSPLLTDGAPLSLAVVTVSTREQAIPYALAALAVLPAVPYLLAVLAGAHAAVARALLQRASGEQLREELVEVSRSRARLVDAFEAERRRIERDLHDGAQQRLISLTMQLGLVRLDLPADSPERAKVTEAHQQAKQLMAELRELIRGIHPRVLTDRGLPAALGELADQSAVPVTVEADVDGRPPAHVEGTAYFVAAEALTNIAKHSGAATAAVTAGWRRDVLTLEVRDDGRGGADPSGGSGLTGLADRAAVAGGRMFLSSPAGGPTVLRLELPCSLREHPSE